MATKRKMVKRKGKAKHGEAKDAVVVDVGDYVQARRKGLIPCGTPRRAKTVRDTVSMLGDSFTADVIALPTRLYPKEG